MSGADAGTGRVRFIPKRNGEGRGATWRVYDLQRGSYPYQTPELGKVAQDLAKEADAQAECDRLTAAHGWLDVKKRGAVKAPANAVVVETHDDPDEGTDGGRDDDAA